jgi:hypothetical protein
MDSFKQACTATFPHLPGNISPAIFSAFADPKVSTNRFNRVDWAAGARPFQDFFARR